jgi:hypothetical protein
MKYLLLTIILLIITSCKNVSNDNNGGNVEIIETTKNDFNEKFQLIKSWFVTNYEFCEEVKEVDEGPNKFTVIGESGNWMSAITVDSLFIKGDLNGDNKDETIVQITHAGGGCGGNIEFSQFYLIEAEGFVKEISRLSQNSNQPTERYQLQLKRIEGGKIIGSVYGVVGEGVTKYDDVYKTIEGYFIYKRSEDGLMFFGKEKF